MTPSQLMKKIRKNRELFPKPKAGPSGQNGEDFSFQTLLDVANQSSNIEENGEVSAQDGEAEPESVDIKPE